MEELTAPKSHCLSPSACKHVILSVKNTSYDANLTCGCNSVLFGRGGLGDGGRGGAGIGLFSVDGGLGASLVAAKAAREMLRIAKTNLRSSIASDLWMRRFWGGANIGDRASAHVLIYDSGWTMGVVYLFNRSLEILKITDHRGRRSSMSTGHSHHVPARVQNRQLLHLQPRTQQERRHSKSPSDTATRRNFGSSICSCILEFHILHGLNDVAICFPPSFPLPHTKGAP